MIQIRSASTSRFPLPQHAFFLPAMFSVVRKGNKSTDSFRLNDVGNSYAMSLRIDFICAKRYFGFASRLDISQPIEALWDF